MKVPMIDRAVIGEKEARKIIEAGGRGVGHTSVLLRGVVQACGLCDGPLLVVAFPGQEAMLASKCAEIALDTGLLVRRVSRTEVLINGVTTIFRSAHEGQRMAGDTPLHIFHDLGAERYCALKREDHLMEAREKPPEVK
jgi:hypothetical protein